MKSVLSVQSHVVHGYVGGRAATFPLQYLGWEVDNINTVNFSNHTGYGRVEGSSLLNAEMQSLFEGLQNISCRYDAIILGYIPTPSLIDILAQNIVLMKKDNPALIYICDTVMGDQGHLYVDDLCVKAYKSLLASGLVDLITPNQFELELLCDFAIDSADSLKNALKFIHSKYDVKHIVVSSLSGFLSLFNDGCNDFIYCAVSTKDEDTVEVYLIPEIKSYFTGVGDLFTALLLDKFTRNSGNLPLAVGQVLNIMSHVLKLTHTTGIDEFCRSKGINYDPMTSNDEEIIQGTINDGETMKFFELRVIESRMFYDLTEIGDFRQTTI
ncbi:Ribokinase-like protein [Metschnikowia bicuspidata var. bicuspidata NRRL YB-4993]|uniref:pyridoxal kinase n=1 Tax=Metschnikowia bicuspidata var. bicuspidata NRRL YB-4993 TaxID=869754 RepID=A0A1A0HJW1_9ASCO|nr:Ribokinase-like protein [Metschnikowia bicuspidata var. bicuspidata NRRL YB-4993]OBA24464.1 Ribokinase-like protein [Metschnikowia bicuspidata var. bicuspidata NRRL YB-4993]